ncbi:MAG: tRNA lysidine(34) synthetase TilS [Planctomycetota bacterium]
MTPSGVSRRAIRPLRSTTFARTIVAPWRRLAPIAAGPTLVACSGGADSVALLVALASAEPDSIRVAHVIHDMRSLGESHADADHVRALASALDLEFHQQAVTGAGTEAEARSLRYDALAEIARAVGCPHVATAHHADDQLETFLMRAIRGAGPAGLRSIAERRELTPGVHVVRPALGVTHDECVAFCREAGVAWREDATNLDTDRTRAALRARVLPALRAIRSDAAQRVTDAARLQRDAHRLVADAARALAKESTEWERSGLTAHSDLVVGHRLREDAIMKGCSPDRLTQQKLVPALHAIRDGSTEPREFDWGSGVVLRVTAHRVALARADGCD